MTATGRAGVDEMLLQFEVERFLAREAQLLDARRFDDWVELFSDDVHYWMPVRSARSIKDYATALSRPDEVAHFDETKSQLRQRTGRLTSSMAWSDDPASQTRHLVTNVTVAGADDAGAHLVRCNVLVHQNRMERHVEVFVGAREDLLRPDPQSPLGWRIARRHVFLDQTVVLARAITTFF